MRDTKIAVGQFWSTPTGLYKVTSMQGPDSCYPIVMREVARDPAQEARELCISKNMYPQGGDLLADRLKQSAKLRKMFQEKQWFDLRDDVVKPWTGTVEEWREARTSQLYIKGEVG